MEACTCGALDTVVRPEGLRAIFERDLFVRLWTWMVRGERCMAGRVPVLGEDDVFKMAGEAVDLRHDFVTAGNSELAARAEIALHVDDEEQIVVSHEVGQGQNRAPSRVSSSMIWRAEDAAIATIWSASARVRTSGGAKPNASLCGMARVIRPCSRARAEMRYATFKDGSRRVFAAGSATNSTASIRPTPRTSPVMGRVSKAS